MMTQSRKNTGEIKARVAEFAEWVSENHGLTRGTLRTYSRALQAVLLGGGDPYDYLRRDYAPSYRWIVAATLRYWAEFTQDADLSAKLKEDRTKRLIHKPQTDPEVAKTALSPEELVAFLDALGDRSVPAWAIPCLGLMAKLGLRSNDMLRLSRRDVIKAVDSDRIRIVGKGEKVRWLPTSPVEEELDLLLEIDDPPDWTYVWDIIATGSRDPENRPEYAYHLIRKEVQAVAKLAGIEGMTTHRLRKAAAHRLYEASGHNMALVSKVLGHADPKTTMTYLEIDMDDYIAATGDLMKG